MEIRASCPHIQSILQAAVRGNVKELELFSDTQLEEARCTSGCTALHWAAGTDQVAVVRFLVLQRGWNVNEKAIRKAQDRTPLHYACRNGCIETARCLVEELGANVDARAKHGVTPFQLAVWRNHLHVCKWLVEDCKVDPCQVNDFDCGAVHWLGISPPDRADETTEIAAINTDSSSSSLDPSKMGRALLPLAEWLAKQPGINFHAKQRQGHTALHKAAWMGHYSLCEYLHTQHGLYDDCTDQAGNYAADLAEMAHTERHLLVAQYLRDYCSRQKAHSCAILGVPLDANETTIRAAYKRQVRLVHPDKVATATADNKHDNFDTLQRAYRHLIEERGRGSQSNPAHSLKLMIQVGSSSSSSSSRNDIAEEEELDDDDCFKARLVAVLLEYGDKGLDLSNLKKKWKQVWPDVDFPHAHGKVSDWIRQQAGDVVDLRHDPKGCLRVHAKYCSREKVVAAAKAQA